MRLLNIDLVSYAAGVHIQENAVKDLAAGGPPRLILLEHAPVITFGRNGGEENLPFAVSSFKKQGIEIAKSSRGGNITCHYPGQLVAYPIMRVDRLKGGLRSFFHNMEESVIRTLGVFDIKGERIEDRAGVWVNGKKISSVGIAVKHWISSHGLSLNVAGDVSLFEIVAPCGLQGVSATSIHRELDSPGPSMADVKRAFVSAFADVFMLQLENTP